MATKTEYVSKTVIITVTREEIEQLLIAKYANLPLTSVPEVDFEVDNGNYFTGAAIEYKIYQPSESSSIE